MSVRRTWDKDVYAQKAAERAWREESEEESGAQVARGVGVRSNDKEEFKAAEKEELGYRLKSIY